MPCQILISGKVLNDQVFDTLGHFCLTSEYNKIGWLLLIKVDRVRKEKIKLKGLTS